MKAEWQIKKLGEVCRFINGKAYKKDELLNSGKYPVLRVGNFFTNTHWYYSDLELPDDKYCDNEDLLYAWSASFGPRIWNGGKVIYHYHIWKLIPDTELVTRDFLYWFLEWDTEKIKEEQGTGTTMIHVSKGSMEARRISFPPLTEQQRIVALIENAFESIDKAKENAEKNLLNAKELFESYLQSVFANLGDDWEEKKLRDLFDVRDGTHDSPTYQKDGFPLVTSKNLKNGLLDLTKIKLISEKDYKKINQRSKVDQGDVLFAMIGTIGNPIVVEEEPNFAIKNVALFKVNDNQNSYYLKYYLGSKAVTNKMVSDAKGTTQKFVSLGYLREFKILIPPLPIQCDIVAKLNSITIETKQLQSIYQQKLANLDELKKSILQKAFNGEL